MKIEYFENQFGLDITMTPETPSEVAQCIRYAKNALAVKPDVYFSFSSDVPHLSLWLKKKNKKVQETSLRPNYI